MRNKPWAGPELDACPFFIRHPEELRGKWQDWFLKKQPVHLELGCGKGWFLAELAPRHPEINYIGIDLKDAVLAPARRVLVRAFQEKPVENVALTAQDIERLMSVMNEQDSVDRIYINFCNPWPRPRHYKRRLTYPTRLKEYRRILRPGAELWFKTDDEALYRDTIRYLEESGYQILWQTEDLHQALDAEEDLRAMTEHEKMFSEKGIRIKALQAMPKFQEL